MTWRDVSPLSSISHPKENSSFSWQRGKSIQVTASLAGCFYLWPAFYFTYSNLAGMGSTAVLQDETQLASGPSKSNRNGSPVPLKTYKIRIAWPNVLWFTYTHIGAFYGIYLLSTKAKPATIFWLIFVGIYTAFGVTAGVHRYWSHKSYKAKLPLRLLLAFFQTSSFQYDIFKWAREHRIHHKFSETDADPHNPTRGLFFSHIGWLLVRKHPDVIAKGKKVDVSDLERDGVVMWQKKLYWILAPICAFAIPTLVPWYFWGEDLWTSWYATLFRFTYVVHCALVVNSVAHRIGTRPYDKTMMPADNIYTAILSQGDGWHNYHHVFPWDYRTSEYSGHRMNVTTAFIDFMASIGWAYDLKTASTELIVKRANRTGDGTHKLAGKVGLEADKKNSNHHQEIEGSIWGLEDQDMDEKDKELVQTLHPLPTE